MHILFNIHIDSKLTWFDINWLALLSSLIFPLKGQELKGKNGSSKINWIDKSVTEAVMLYRYNASSTDMTKKRRKGKVDY